LLLITAMIWGFAFTAQKTGMAYIGPFTYNGVRFLMGIIPLIPLLVITKKKRAGRGNAERSAENRDSKPGREEAGYLLLYSALAGFAMFAGVSLQQFAMAWTSVGNCGFITGFYVVLIPVAGIFLGKKTGLPTWLGAFFAIAGLFFVSGVSGAQAGISAEGAAVPNRGDVLTAIASVFWTFHVLITDRAVHKADPVFFSAGQFFVCGMLGIIAGALDIGAAAGIEAGPEIFSAGFSFDNLLAGRIPLLYGGLASVGIAYTLQAVAQQSAPPAHAAIILCLESVFAAAGGMLLLGESPSGRTIAGFALMLAGMLTTQWDVIRGGFRK